MIRVAARAAALLVAALDLFAAWQLFRFGRASVSLREAAVASGLALLLCATAFAMLLVAEWRQRGLWRHGTPRLPVSVPRGYVGAAVLGGIAGLTAMGQRFGLYIFMAGVVLIALALSQAVPRRA